KSLRHQICRSGAEIAAIEVLRQKRSARLLPGLVVGAGVLCAWMPARRQKPEARGRWMVSPAFEWSRGLLEVGAGKALFEPRPSPAVAHADGVARLAGVFALLGARPVPAAEGPLPTKGDALEGHRVAHAHADRALEEGAITEDANSLLEGADLEGDEH